MDIGTFCETCPDVHRDRFVEPGKGETMDVKPGYKTTEFWLAAIAEIVGLLVMSGAIVQGGLVGRIVGGVVAVLSALGYNASRAKVKAGAPDSAEGG